MQLICFKKLRRLGLFFLRYLVAPIKHTSYFYWNVSPLLKSKCFWKTLSWMISMVRKQKGKIIASYSKFSKKNFFINSKTSNIKCLGVTLNDSNFTIVSLSFFRWGFVPLNVSDSICDMHLVLDILFSIELL